MVKQEVKFVADERGITVKVYGARTSFAYLNAPDKEGKFRSQFILPTNTPGMADFVKAYREFGKARFPGIVWKSAAVKTGSGIIEEKVNAGLDAADFAIYQDATVLSGMSYPDKTTGKGPDVRGDCYSGAIVAAGLRVVPFEFTEGGTKSVGLKAYVNAVVFQEAGERLGGAERMTADDLGVAMPDPLAGTDTKTPAGEDEIPF